MHDAIALEEKGIPTAVIVTAAFVHEAHMQGEALGMRGLEPVVITHPLSSLTEEKIEDRAREAVPQVIRILLEGKIPEA